MCDSFKMPIRPQSLHVPFMELPNLHWPFRHGNVFACCRSGFRCAHEGCDQRRRAEAWLQFTVAVEKLLPPADVIFQNLVESSPGGNLHDAFVEFVARAESLGVPRRNLSEHPAAVFLAKNFNHQIQMPAHHPNPLGKGGFGGTETVGWERGCVRSWVCDHSRATRK